MKRIILLFALILNLSLQAQCWESVSSGQFHTLGLRSDGSLWAWGNPNTYALGIDILTTNYPYGTFHVPRQVGNDYNWKAVYASSNNSFAFKTDGTLWGWGGGVIFQANQITPIQISADTNWQTLSVGINHQLAIKSDGTLWAWGNNAYGQIGDGTRINNNYYTPLQIGNDTDWKWISAGSSRSYAIKTDGTLWAWGGIIIQGI